MVRIAQSGSITTNFARSATIMDTPDWEAPKQARRNTFIDSAVLIQPKTGMSLNGS